MGLGCHLLHLFMNIPRNCRFEFFTRVLFHDAFCCMESLKPLQVADEDIEPRLLNGIYSLKRFPLLSALSLSHRGSEIHVSSTEFSFASRSVHLLLENLGSRLFPRLLPMLGNSVSYLADPDSN